MAVGAVARLLAQMTAPDSPNSYISSARIRGRQSPSFGLSSLNLTVHPSIHAHKRNRRPRWQSERLVSLEDGRAMNAELQTPLIQPYLFCSLGLGFYFPPHLSAFLVFLAMTWQKSGRLRMAMNGCRGDPERGVGICETRSLPAVDTPAMALDQLHSAVAALKCNPPMVNSGILRLQKAVHDYRWACTRIPNNERIVVRV
ncbi:hypothetical protein ACLOJK_032699 [Asimina triloba]